MFWLVTGPWLGQDEDFNDEEMRAAFAAKLQDPYDMGRTDASRL